jgi:hypothetical protein
MKKYMSGSHYRRSRNVDIPCAMGRQLIARSPRCPGLLVTVACEIVSRGLDPGVGGSGPHAFAVRTRQHSSNAPRASIASRPAFVTTRPPLLPGRDKRISDMIFRKTEEKYFCEKGWTGFLCDCPTGKSIAQFFRRSRCGAGVSRQDAGDFRASDCVMWMRYYGANARSQTARANAATAAMAKDNNSNDERVRMRAHSWPASIALDQRRLKAGSFNDSGRRMSATTRRLMRSRKPVSWRRSSTVDAGARSPFGESRSGFLHSLDQAAPMGTR